MTDHDQIRYAHTELIDIAWELQQADLKEFEARVDKVIAALYVAMEDNPRTHTHDECDSDNGTPASPDEIPAFHRHAVLTLRLILAAFTELTNDSDDVDGAAMFAIADEVDDCPDCWRAIATQAVFRAADYMSLHLGDDKALERIQVELASALDDGQP